MIETLQNFKVNVSSEIGRLRCLLIHSPDSGLGNIVPSKAQDWLFEDIVHLETVRKNEYDYYLKLLLYFLDPQKIRGKLAQIDGLKERNFYKPAHKDFHGSTKVIEIQQLLAEVLVDENLKMELISAVCAFEHCTYQLKLKLRELSATELAETFISGAIRENQLVFAPIPNFIFTRDVGTVINQHILLNKPAKKARARESLLAKYVFYNHSFFANYKNNIIELPDTLEHVILAEENDNYRNTLEGGDVMMVSKNHLLIGCSERTSALAISETIKLLFEKDVVEKVTVIKIPNKRDYMHMDTVFTQVKKNMWVILESIAKADKRGSGFEPIDHLIQNKPVDKVEVTQFTKGNITRPKKYESVEELLADVSTIDLKSSKKVEFIYSGNQQFPSDAREQWTDSCNLLAIKEGVVIGYDRNDVTLNTFREKGFLVIAVKELLQKFESGELNPETLENTFITIPSAELSRARGGFHCMSMPILRDELGS
ncbi:arginine deiminase family protein [Pedobacter arcticus]|uniref:arginine deiminase family protein n=1 Tax=Pedobacter arcticus TaxID=752140 RepID=UPI0002EAA9D4|nr:arginine deiminase family protein [Pedobacter arcticus]